MRILLVSPASYPASAVASFIHRKLLNDLNVQGADIEIYPYPTIWLPKLNTLRLIHGDKMEDDYKKPFMDATFKRITSRRLIVFNLLQHPGGAPIPQTLWEFYQFAAQGSEATPAFITPSDETTLRSLVIPIVPRRRNLKPPPPPPLNLFTSVPAFLQRFSMAS